MTVSELIEYLEQYPADAEVLVAYQPNYPMQVSISGVASDAEVRAAAPNFDDDDTETSVDLDDISTVYIATAQGNDYAPNVWRAIGR